MTKAQQTKNISTGRRKEAVARVILTPGKGDITINNTPYDIYFIRETDRIIGKQPLIATNTLTKFDVSAKLCGGGLTGQAGALRHGIARALLETDVSFKEILRKQGYLTRDPRTKERKKYGQKGARKRFQWTKR
ncbi:MAG TPA: 30S ribosomal protein S9 [Candidatus Omnitrophota bacterium]|mgnify:CR=1 FL=1|nr:30S ribosomal protein S9 [Candidatus Omnitrophota bacterium]HPT06561.1 30S ribosomal protein S9 [Candidatus Omnitrophota bacterium]